MTVVVQSLSDLLERIVHIFNEYCRKMYPSDPHSYPVLFMNICNEICVVNHLYDILLGIKNVGGKWKQIAVCRWNFITEWVADVTSIEFIYSM